MKSEIGVQIYELDSTIVQNDELRLNASSYRADSLKSKKILKNLENKEFLIKKLNDFSEKTFIGARSKRIFVSKKKGIPYLKPKELFFF